MKFRVPQGGSIITHLNLHPKVPDDNVVQVWPLSLSEDPHEELEEIWIDFDINSTPRQRRVEQAIFVIQLMADVEGDAAWWRFATDGLIFAPTSRDILDDLETRVHENKSILTLTVTCRSDIEQHFNFRFLGLRIETASGEGVIYSSRDPLGGIRRN